MLPQCSHITKKRGVYYYRRRIPKSPNREVALSLRTRMFRVAECLATELDQEFRRLTEDVTTDDKIDLTPILRNYLKRRLASDMRRRVETPHAPVYAFPEPGRSDASVDLEWIDGQLAEARSELTGRLYDHQRPLIDDLMEDNNIPEQYRNAFAHGLFQAHVQLWETFGLTLAQARAIIKEVATVTAIWRDTAKAVGARSAEINRMASAFEHDDLKRALAL